MLVPMPLSKTSKNFVWSMGRIASSLFALVLLGNTISLGDDKLGDDKLGDDKLGEKEAFFETKVRPLLTKPFEPARCSSAREWRNSPSRWADHCVSLSLREFPPMKSASPETPLRVTQVHLDSVAKGKRSPTQNRGSRNFARPRRRRRGWRRR